MKTLKLLALVVTVCAATMASADVEKKREMKIVIDAQSGDGVHEYTWISNDAGFDMEGMQVGESQSIVDESGRPVLITRESDGFRFDVDGESIRMPDMGAHMAGVAIVDGDDMTADYDVEIIRDDRRMAAGARVTIITDEALDASTQESIKAVLQSVGRGDEVRFIDGSSGGEARHVNIVRKKVEIVQ